MPCFTAVHVTDSSEIVLLFVADFCITKKYAIAIIRLLECLHVDSWWCGDGLDLCQSSSVFTYL